MATFRIITSLKRLHCRTMVGRFIAETSSNRTISSSWAVSRCLSTICDSETSSMNTMKHPSNLNSYISKRFKKTKNRRPAGEDEDDEDEDEEDGDENPMLMDEDATAEDGSTMAEIDVPSLRLDAVAKNTLRITRSKVEEAFYKGELFINGERPNKKSLNISRGDEIDLILGVNKEDRNLVDIKKVLILDFPDKSTESGRMRVKVQTWQKVTVEAYK